MKYKLSFIGLGHLATSIVRGILENGMISKQDICFYDISKKQITIGKNDLCIKYIPSMTELVESSKYIFLCVKPQNLKEVFQEIRKANLSCDQCIVSCVAGLKIVTLKKMLPDDVSIVRTMPNLTVAVQSGVTFLAKDTCIREEILKDIASIFDCVGQTYMAEEKQFDTITAITGVGPAYFFYFVEILTKTGEDMGIQNMQDTIVQIMLGSAKMLKHSSASDLRSSVASEKGVTVAALSCLDEKNLTNVFFDAVSKAQLRSKDISQEIQIDLEHGIYL